MNGTLPPPNTTPSTSCWLLRAALVGACCALLPAAAGANEYSRIEWGLGWIDEGSTRFARYNGLDQAGGYGVLNIDWWSQAEGEDPNPVEMRLVARDLGLDRRSLAIERRRPGVYRVWLSYVELPVFFHQQGSTPFEGVGSERLQLPAGWVPGATTASMAQLLPSLSPFTPGAERRRLGLGLERWLSERWDSALRVSQEHKQGMQVLAGTVGNTGGNPRSAFLPTPVDYRTREMEWSLHFSDPQRQFALRYLISLFDNANRSLVWQNPFSAINGWDASAGYPSGDGQLSLPPDNQFHQLSLSGAQRWSNGLRLAADVAFGRATQDDAFLPYTINPQLAASISQPLPRDSLDGRIDTQRAQLLLSQQTGTRFDWAARLRHDQHDNRTPHDEFVYIAGDSAPQNTGETSSQRRFNEPYSFDQTLMSVDAGYRTADKGRLKLSWQHRDLRRELTERLRTEEQRFGLRFRQPMASGASWSLNAERADRDGSTYVGNRPFLSAYSPGYTRTVAGEFENHPDLRRYHQADRERWQWGGNLSLEIGRIWHLQFDAQRIEDDYRRSVLGLQRAESDVFSTDLSLVPGNGWSAYAFHVWESHQSRQAGQAFRGGSSRLEQAFNPDNRWQTEHRDRIITGGLGGQWQGIDERLTLSLDMIVSRARGRLDFSAGPAIAVAPLPDETSRLRSLRFGARWRVDADRDVQLRLWNEDYREYSAVRDALPVDQLANVLWFGEQPGDYRVNVITLSFVCRF